MAIVGSDGSITLTTKVDTSGINIGISSIKSVLQRVNSAVLNVKTSFASLKEQKATLLTLTQAIKDQEYVISELNSEYAKYVAKGKASSAQAKKIKADINSLNAELYEMRGAATALGTKGTTALSRFGMAFKTILSYFIGIQTIFALFRFSKEAGEFATQTEASVQRLIDIYGSASESVGNFIDQNAKAIGMSRASAASFASVYGNLFGVWADQATNAELTNRYLNMTAVVASKTGRTVADVQERIRSGLLGNTEAIEDLGVFVNVKTIEMTDAFKRMADGRSWEQLDAYSQQQIRTMAILEQATAKYGNTVADTSALTRAQYKAAYEDFKNTWGQLVNTALVPALKVLTQFFTIATKGLQIIAKLSGKTINTSVEQTNAIDGAVNSQNKLTDAVKKTNKEVEKGVADFDEIHTLTKSTAETSGSAGNAGGLSQLNLGVSDADYDNSFKDKISGDMAFLMSVIGLALAAVGLILLFHKKVAWGIGFIIAGAAMFSVSAAATASSDQVTPISEQLMKIMAIAGFALVALGLILLVSGGIKGLTYSIPCIIAGIGVLGIAAVAVKKGKASEEAEQMLLDIMLIAGAAMLALGVILLLVGVINPLSIGLVVAGAASLAGAVALNPNAIKEKIKKFFTDNAGLVVGVSLALLVIGIVLVCTGVGIPLAIGLIVVGVAGLAATVAVNWNFIKEKVTSVISAIVDWVKTWGLLAMGIILIISGVGMSLGLALLIKGGQNLTEAKNPTWLAILDKIKEVWGKVKAFWNANIAKYFTASWWGNLGKTAINSLIRWIISGLNRLIDKVNSFGFELPEVLGGGRIGFNISHIPIPQLAKGAVLPGGKPFLAWVNDQPSGQTNIEAPLDTIKQAVAEVIAQINVGNNNGFNGRIEIPVVIDGREILRAVRETEGKTGRQTVFGGFANAY